MAQMHRTKQPTVEPQLILHQLLKTHPQVAIKMDVTEAILFVVGGVESVVQARADMAGLEAIARFTEYVV
jgi:hypothetical protein